MKLKIKKALDSAVNNLLTNTNWLTIALKRSDVKILAGFDNEEATAGRIENVQTKVKSFSDSRMVPNCYYTVYNRYVEPGSFVLGFEYYVNGWLNYEWYFIGDRKNGIKRICCVDFVDGQEELAVYNLPLKDIDECDEIYQFANDVLRAFIIEPHLFEIFYEFQVSFFGNDKDIQYDVEYLAEYECIDS